MGDGIVLPKLDKNGVPYLSYSQMNTWHRSKREYIRQYFLGEAFEGNVYTDFGSLVGEALEHNDFSKFSKEDAEFLGTIPRFDEFEREIKLQMGGFYVKGFIDTNTKVEIMEDDGTVANGVRVLSDYKTGNIERKSAEYQSDNYKQLDIYAAALRQQYGITPKEASVILIGRKGNPRNNEELELTREFVKIDKKITDDRLDEVLQFVTDTAKEISDCYKAFLQLTS